MNAPDLNHQATDEAIGSNDGLAHQSAPESTALVAALNLVSETAEAIKAFDEQAARALMRAPRRDYELACRSNGRRSFQTQNSCPVRNGRAFSCRTRPEPHAHP
ncbi:MAG: hypothetical protein FD139_3792 [Methylocystaceae bacterium]|nr:MAG: hypothetical protein FD172_3527 [Methylocystaceae bacterium]TXT42236.1 MAG: hypothetical protein FD139_3792 [Methylocystaceae bacterium]